MKEVPLPCYASAFCCYDGEVYVALGNNTITKVDSNYELQEPFIQCSGVPRSIRVYKDRIYVLGDGLHFVAVYDMFGKLRSHWKFSDYGYTCGLLEVTSNHVVVPVCERTLQEAAKSFLLLYYHNGILHRKVSCPSLSTYTCSVSLHLCSEDTVIIADYNEFCLTKVCIKTGDVLWKNTHVWKPIFVTGYAGLYALAASTGENAIQVLDIKTGEKAGVIKNLTAGFPSYIDCFNETLITGNYRTQSLFFYHINDKCT